jgi:anaerobic magnesium-protoporphyrin IX monomethyl ester cyclase
MRAKVLLVTPPYHCGVVEAAGTWVPLSLVSAAGGLDRDGYEVEIYDAMSLFATRSDIEAKLRASRPAVVGTTAFTATANEAVAVLAAAKAADPGVVTLLGGVHPTFMWRELLEAPGSPVDFVVLGEGEETAPRLLDAVLDGRSPAGVPGVAWRGPDGGAATSGPRPLAADLDALPAAWHLLDWGIYTFRPMPGSVSAVVASSRGCLHACSFCSQQKFWGRAWRGKSPEAFVGELERLRRDFKVDVAMLADETPTADRGRWRRILDLLIERRIGMELMLETRADDIVRDRDWLDDYRRAGIMHIYVGVESGSQQTLERFNKKVRTEVNREAIRLINAAGIISETAFVLGMPDETPESIQRTVELAMEYDPDMAFFMAIAPWPYSDIFKELKPFVASRDFADYNLVKAVVEPRAMTRSQVEAELARAFKTFYMRRLERLESLTPFKRRYMVEVTKLLASHSYLAEQMRGLGGGGMPEAVRERLGLTGRPSSGK